MQNSTKYSSADVQQAIFDVLQPSLRADVQLSAHSSIVDDLGLDSAAVMDFVMELEDRLDISIPLDKIAGVETIGDFAATVSQLMGGG